MKIKCDFCKTEYTYPAPMSGPVKCAVCGHSWIVMMHVRRNAFLTFIAAVCALLSAGIFSAAVIARHQVRVANRRPLVATISEIKTTTDAAGVSHFVVSGRIINQSDEIYGVPDLIIVSRDENGNPIARQKFMPSATLLDPGATTTFSHTLSAPTAGVKKVTVEMPDIDGGK